MSNKPILRLSSILPLGLLAAGAVAAPVTSSSDDQASLSMTVYQQGFALVRDERTVDMAPGRMELGVTDISNQIIPESVFVVGQGVVLNGVEYSRASLTPENLLAKNIGKKVRVMRRNPQTGALAEEEGVLLSASNSVPIVQIGNRVEVGGPDAGWWLAFADVPDGLQGQERLTLDLDNSTRGPQSLTLSYLSHGLSWQADYVGVLRNDTTLTLNGWVSVDNGTNAKYPNARVQLLAGDVHQPNDFQPLMAMARSREVSQAADMASSPVGGYHIYDLPEVITLLPQQRRQVRLLAPRDVPVEREYRVESDGFRNTPEEENVPVMMRLQFRNDAPVLGVPLPAGLVRIYADGPQSMVQYLGEDRIGHTAKDQEIKLRIGTAFDVVAKKTTTSFQRIANQVVELDQEIRLVNTKDQPITIVVAERLPGDWEIQNSSHPHQKVSAQLVEWRIDVPAEGEERLTYRARVQY
ncbi:MAG TPA: hypothetical protein VFY81_01480 [Gammaproteobacteria bacterium]|nr:hypothetical protein [Gammaproteobacteria bacterium]